MTHDPFKAVVDSLRRAIGVPSSVAGFGHHVSASSGSMLGELSHVVRGLREAVTAFRGENQGRRSFSFGLHGSSPGGSGGTSGARDPRRVADPQKVADAGWFGKIVPDLKKFLKEIQDSAKGLHDFRQEIGKVTPKGAQDLARRIGRNPLVSPAEREDLARAAKDYREKVHVAGEAGRRAAMLGRVSQTAFGVQSKAESAWLDAQARTQEELAKAAAQHQKLSTASQRAGVRRRRLASAYRKSKKTQQDIKAFYDYRQRVANYAPAKSMAEIQRRKAERLKFAADPRFVDKKGNFVDAAKLYRQARRDQSTARQRVATATARHQESIQRVQAAQQSSRKRVAAAQTRESKALDRFKAAAQKAGHAFVRAGHGRILAQRAGRAAQAARQRFRNIGQTALGAAAGRVAQVGKAAAGSAIGRVGTIALGMAAARAGSALNMATGAVTLFITAMLAAGRAARAFAEDANARNRPLAGLNANTANAFMELNFGEMMRMMQMANQTNQTAGELARAVNRMRDQELPGNVAAANIRNRLAIGAAGFGGGMAEGMSPAWQKLDQLVEKILNLNVFGFDSNNEMMNSAGKKIGDAISAIFEQPMKWGSALMDELGRMKEDWKQWWETAEETRKRHLKEAQDEQNRLEREKARQKAADAKAAMGGPADQFLLQMAAGPARQQGPRKKPDWPPGPPPVGPGGNH